MQLQQLRAFVAVAETRHFTQAAADLGVSQPTLSKQIHTLESELGAPLFDRARGNVALTAAGEALLPRARRILADADAAGREVAELVGLRRGLLRLGATPSLVTGLAAEVLARFAEAHPRVRLVVREGGSGDLTAELAHGGLDVALVVAPARGGDPALHTEPILTESLVVASDPRLPPPGGSTSGAAVSIEDLRDTPLVMFRDGYDLREVTLAACEKAGFAPTYAVEGGEMDAVLGFVAVGLGVAVVPSLVLARRPDLRATPLRPPGLHRTIAVARRRDVTPSHAARAWRDTLDAYLTEATAWGRLPPGVSLV